MIFRVILGGLFGAGILFNTYNLGRGAYERKHTKREFISNAVLNALFLTWVVVGWDL